MQILNHFKSCLIFLLFLLTLVGGYAQSNIEIGSWKSHLSYREGKRVTQSKDKIIYAAALGLMIIDKNDLSVSFMSKEDGLNDVNINGLYYDRFNEQLIVVYNDAAIDIVRGNEVFYIPFIKTNSTIIGSRNVNHIHIRDENLAYIATDFGVLGLDLKRLEFTFTTFTDLRVNTLTVFNGFLYAGTEEELYRVRTIGVNLTDFGLWSAVPKNNGLPASYEVVASSTFNGQLYVTTGRDLYRSSDGVSFEKLIQFEAGFSARFMSAEGKSLITGIRNNQNASKILVTDTNGTIREGGAGCINRVLGGIEDERGRVWYADEWRTIRYTQDYFTGCNQIEFNSPFSNSAGQITFFRDQAFVAAGGVTEDFNYNFTGAGVFHLTGNEWNNYNNLSHPVFQEKDVINVQAVQYQATTKDLYIGSYWNGVLRLNLENGESQHFNKDNSILRGAVGDEARTRISFLQLDEKQNLWMANYLSSRPLVLKTKDNQWYSYALPGNNNAGSIVIDRSGNKWIPLVTTGGAVVVFNENNTPENTADDRVRLINRNNSLISGNRVNCAMVDLDGVVWVGTSSGPVAFDTGCSDPFSDNCRGSTRTVVVDGIPAPLLRDEDVLSMAVDGANRKWFGTRNGIFVQSPDGLTSIAKFDVNNSPLLDNVIKGLFFNGTTGEMFIVSNLGIQSYRTATTTGGRTHAPEVYAFPNPVRPDYHGTIAIKGLVRDANVKITDINGRLVYETKALGGQAVWDGRDYNGVRAATGVYLVFSANENTSLGKETLVTKIMMVK
jgi:hypothetical protein